MRERCIPRRPATLREESISRTDWRLRGADGLDRGRCDGGVGGGRREGELIAVGWNHLIASDGGRLWTGTGVIAESRDDVIVQEHHGATTSSRSRGRARLAHTRDMIPINI